jgi:hypothetical protein
MSVAPSSFDFEGVTIGETVDKTFVVTNAGPDASGTILVSLSGPNTSAYKIQSDACSGISLPAVGNCQVTVRFSPRVAGERAATLNVTATPGGSLQASLTGNAIAPPMVSLSGSIILFGPVGSNGGSAQQSITLTNTGGAPAEGFVWTVSDPMFSATGDCPTDLGAGASCTINLSFTPPSNGVRTGTFSVDFANTSPVTATLVGEGVTGTEFSVSPQNWFFDFVPQGSHSVPVELTVQNIGPVPGVVSWAFTPPVHFDDGQTVVDLTTPLNVVAGGTCILNTTVLNPTESCTLLVRLSPSETTFPGDQDVLRIFASPGKVTEVFFAWPSL